MIVHINMSWPKRRWVTCVGRKGNVLKTLSEAKRWVEQTIDRGDGSWWCNSVIVQTGSGSTYRGRTIRIGTGRNRRRTVAWTKL